MISRRQMSESRDTSSNTPHFQEYDRLLANYDSPIPICGMQIVLLLDENGERKIHWILDMDGVSTDQILGLLETVKQEVYLDSIAVRMVEQEYHKEAEEEKE
jgi:hypothetical protein